MLKQKADFSKYQKRAIDYLLSQQKNGYWPYWKHKDAALEVSAWAAIVCRNNSASVDAFLSRLSSEQNTDGGWSNDNLDSASDWSTGAALFSLACLQKQKASFASVKKAELEKLLRRAESWLLENRAEHYSSAAKFALLIWKGPEYDYARGWPWTKDTFDWVEPTSYVLLSLKNPALYSNSKKVNRAIELAESYLLNLILPGGGWNFGDRNPYGAQNPPDVASSSLALMALKNHKEEKKLKESINWLAGQAQKDASPSRKAWAALALASMQEDTDQILAGLAEIQAKDGSFSDNLLTHTLASLAFECRLNPDLIC